MPHEYTTIAKKRAISQQVQKMVLDPDVVKNYPNQSEMLLFMIKNALNEHDPLFPGQEKIKIKQAIDSAVVRTVHGKINPAVRTMVSAINKAFGTKLDAFEFGFPKVSPTDKTIGLMAQPFYISALTSRPGFWAAQVLTAPFGMRQIFRDAVANNPSGLDAFKQSMTAMARGVSDTMYGGDAAYQKFIAHMQDSTHSMEPQFHNHYTLNHQ
jgi:hypothetical protein